MLCQRKKCGDPLEAHTPECQAEKEIIDVDSEWNVIVIGKSKCKCVGFLELVEPLHFEIVDDETDRRIDSV